VYQHNTQLEHDQLLRGFDSVFAAPHSRYGEIPLAEYQQQSDLNILASSDTAGVYLAATKDKRMVFITGHPEYDPMTLDKEYRRDLTADLNPSLPINYYPNNDTEKSPIVSWRAHGSLLYTNWLNYYVYQETPYDLTQLTGDNH
jgi:homoserine O-succinyltransferase